MQIELKAFLISVPICIVLSIILAVAGFYLIGEEWSMTGFPIITFVTGLLTYFNVKKVLNASNSESN